MRTRLALLVSFVVISSSLAAQKPRPTPDPDRLDDIQRILRKKGVTFSDERFGGLARAGDSETILMFLEAGQDPNKGDGDTPPLEEAATRGHLAVVEALLGAGANPNAKNGNGTTPLQEAVVQKQVSCVRALVKAGANLNLAYKGSGDTPLVRASNVGSTEMILTLLEGGADPNRTDGNGSSVLLWEAQKGHEDIVKALLAKGADPNLRAAGGGTALMMAVVLDKPEVVKLLLAGGAKIGKDREVLMASAPTPEMKRILQNPPPAKKPTAPKGEKK